MFNHAFGLMFKPSAQWHNVAGVSEATLKTYMIYPCLMALLPAASWYYGTTQVGWSVGDGDPIRLTEDSAQAITILFYFAMLASIATIGWFIHWMADTYGADSSTIKGIVIAGLTATPLFLAGAVGFYPVLWIDMLIGVAALSWAVYLLYLGIPIVMGIPEERGFLFSSAVIAICLVIFICILVGSVILWDLGAAPAFTD